MKRVLLIGFILAICILAMPQGVMATTVRTADVSATIQTYIELYAPTPPTVWALTAGDHTTGYNNIYSATSSGNVKPLQLTIETNKAWRVDAEAVNGNTAVKAHMTGPAHSLRDHLYIEQATPGNFADLYNLNAIASGTNAQIGVQPFARDLSQRVYSDDTPEAYAIVITLTASNT
jgi:hypothetical protein